MSRTVGHYAHWLLYGVLGVLALEAVVQPPASLVPWYALAPLFAVAAILALTIFSHDRHLCAHCVRSMPLDANRAAVPRTVRFQVAHLFDDPMLAALHLSSVAGSALLYAHPVGRYAWVLALVSLGYLLRAYVTHQRLRPWCPQCRADGPRVTTVLTGRG